MSTPNSNPPISTPPSTSVVQNLYSKRFSHFQRMISTSAGASNVVPIKSEEEFNSALTKAQEESLPSIFYFTAVWCGPCRFISPLIEDLSKKYPHVTTYKIDIDQEGLGSTLGKLNITAVPTLHFFQNGQKESEMVGADIAHLNNIVENLYKKD
ncbi:hypothetical protein SLA2020_230400 [Shorea laevis]